ncbi:MAG TPA: hypothetical protein VF143_09475 [Candidatus Nanopelagicales bacterium]
MSDPRAQAGTEHDTMVIPTGTPPADPYQGPSYPGQPYPGQPSAGSPYPGEPRTGSQWATGIAPGAPAGPGAPGQDAAYWQAKYRRQRAWLGVVAGMALLAMLGVVGLGFAAYQAVTANPLVAAAQDLGRQLQGGTDDGQSDQAPNAPEDSAPQDPQQAPGATGIPLPEQLQGLGQALGVTDVGQLLDMAVQNGLMSQEQADQLRAALQAGKAMGDLGRSFGQGEGTTPES